MYNINIHLFLKVRILMFEKHKLDLGKIVVRLIIKYTTFEY